MKLFYSFIKKKYLLRTWRAKPAHGDLQSSGNSNRYETNQVPHDLTLNINQNMSPFGDLRLMKYGLGHTWLELALLLVLPA